MRSWLTLIVLFFIALLTSGCGGDSFGCSASVEPGIIVSVFDSESKAPAAEGAVVTIRDGDYTETIREFYQTYTGPVGEQVGPQSFRGADERSGTYTVRVEKAGYEPWEMTRVRVRDDGCHVQTVRLEAYLKRIE